MPALQHKLRRGVLAWALAMLPAAGFGQVSSATNRPVLGNVRTAYLRFDSSVVVSNASAGTLRRPAPPPGAVTNVSVAGTWNVWTGRHGLVKTGEDLWELDTRTLGARLGQHEFKFIVNGEWEAGANRVLPINLEGEIERPPAMIQRAAIDDFQMIRVFFRQALPKGIRPVATLDPPVPVAWTEVVTEMEDARQTGYLFAQGQVTFLFDPAAYGLALPPGTKVAVAGNFNGWDGGGWNPQWVLKRGKLKGTWEGSVQLAGLRLPPGEKDLVFKFVLNGNQ